MNLRVGEGLYPSHGCHIIGNVQKRKVDTDESRRIFVSSYKEVDKAIEVEVPPRDHAGGEITLLTERKTTSPTLKRW